MCRRYPLNGKLHETQRRSGCSNEEINLSRAQGLGPQSLDNLAGRSRSQQNPTSPFPSFMYQLKRLITGKLVIFLCIYYQSEAIKLQANVLMIQSKLR